MSCQKKLQYLIHDNFEAYRQAHVDHFNVTGEDFVQYHSLLKDLYEKLFEYHDTLAETLRTMDTFVDHSHDCKSDCVIEEHNGDRSTSAVVLRSISNLQSLVKTATGIEAEASKERHVALVNVLGDYCQDLSKLLWMLKSCQ